MRVPFSDRSFGSIRYKRNGAPADVVLHGSPLSMFAVVDNWVSISVVRLSYQNLLAVNDIDA